jgi:hypothetical protein
MPARPQTAQVDRLLLEIPGGSADQGRKVARLVAAGLAAAGALPAAGDLPTLRIAIRAEPQDDAESLARRIVAGMLRELARLP